MTKSNKRIPLTLNIPKSITPDWCVMRYDLQNTMIFHNDHGLVAVVNDHEKITYICSYKTDKSLYNQLKIEVIGAVIGDLVYEDQYIPLNHFKNWLKISVKEPHSFPYYGD